MDKLQAIFFSEPLELPSNNLGGNKLHRRQRSAIEQYDIPNTDHDEKNVTTAVKLELDVVQIFPIPRSFSYSGRTQREQLRPPGTLN